MESARREDNRPNDQHEARMTWTDRLTENAILFPEAVGWMAASLGRLGVIIASTIASAWH